MNDTFQEAYDLYKQYHEDKLNRLNQSIRDESISYQLQIEELKSQCDHKNVMGIKNNFGQIYKCMFCGKILPPPIEREIVIMNSKNVTEKVKGISKLIDSYEKINNPRNKIVRQIEDELGQISNIIFFFPVEYPTCKENYVLMITKTFRIVVCEGAKVGIDWENVEDHLKTELLPDLEGLLSKLSSKISEAIKAIKTKEEDGQW